MKNLYIIAGCNGAGKTTASFNILPSILNCREFVNADEIARGISPFHPEGVSIDAARLMLKRIDELFQMGEDFAIETTLASRSHRNTIRNAKELGYSTTLIYFWLESPELAIDRVKNRVSEGGHNIPVDVIIRRYFAGVRNLFEFYSDICDNVFIYDNSKSQPELIYDKELNGTGMVHVLDKFETIMSLIK
jgi:predicted ABC-type ATPase